MKRLCITFLVMAGLFFLLSLSQVWAQSIGYVDVSKTDDTGNGTSWGSAYKTLTNALLKIAGSSTTTLYVAQGTYNSFSNATGLVVSNHTLQGGYPTGGGTRDWVAYPTIIDGTNGVRAFNKSASGLFTLDGFTVQNARYDGSGPGLNCTAGSLLVQNCQFIRNTRPNGAQSLGGAVCSSATTNTFIDCLFLANTNLTVNTSSGALYLGAGKHLLSGCTFSNNYCGWAAGAVDNSGDLTASNCVFSGNGSNPGTWRGGGAVRLNGSVVTNTFVNCQFTSNFVGASGSRMCGGAVHVSSGDATRSTRAIFQGCLFTGNSAAGANNRHGSAISQIVSDNDSAFVGSRVECTDCVFSNNTGVAALYAVTNGVFILTRCDFVGQSVGALNTLADTWATNCSFIANSNASGGAVYLGGIYSTNNFVNCTFFTNMASSGQGGAIISTNANVNMMVTNCIFWGNTATGSGTNIQNAGALAIGYSDINTNDGWVSGGTVVNGGGIMVTNPLFASITAPYDVHEQSVYGRWSAYAGAGMFVFDTNVSACIDAGDSSPYAVEPQPNGGKINLGRYGNTTEASKSSFGTSPAVTNSAALVNSLTSVTLNGYLVYTNESPTAVYIYWGDHDGATNKTGAGAWDNTALVSSMVSSGAFSKTISPAANGIYCCKCYASNSVGDFWASGLQYFMTDYITVQATDNGASEIGVDSGTFTVYRPTGLTNFPITVYYSLSGTASNGLDYQQLIGNVTISAGSTSAVVTVTPFIDANWAEGNETVTLTVSSGYNYLVGGANSAVVTITNNAAYGAAYLDISRPDDTGNGTSWATAFQSLSNAITKMPGLSSTNLWVAKGTYIVANVDIKTNSVFGGFPAGGGAWTTRDWANNITIFDGNLTNRVLQRSVAGNNFIDGLHIVNGSVAGAGGGFSSSANSPVAFYNCTFTNNTVTGNRGGAVYMQASAGFVTNVFSNCTFIGNATLTANYGGGAITIFTGANLNYFYSCNFIANRSAAGGGAFETMNSGAGSGIFIYNSLFSNNISVVGNGGAIGSGDSALIITNSVFTGNTSSNGSGATIYLSTGRAYVDNCRFVAGFNPVGRVAGLYLPATVVTNEIYNSYFADNVHGGVDATGGGALNNSGRLIMTNTVFINNVTTNRGHGAAVFLATAGYSNYFESCVFISNSVLRTESGGAVYVNALQTNVFVNCTFVTNSVAGTGGALRTSAGGELYFFNCGFTNNWSASQGGAIYVQDNILCIINTSFVGNTSTNGVGGAINYVRAGAVPTIKQTSFVGNTAKTTGGAINFNNASTGSFVNCTFFTNKAGTAGGAINCVVASVFGMTNNIFWKQAATTTGTNIDNNGGTIYADYSNIDTNSGMIRGTQVNGNGIFFADPLFASEIAPYDVHEKSQYGRWTPSGWRATDTQTSPCIDAGVPYNASIPESAYANEPAGNGGRINLGVYGNTAQASKSSQPTIRYVDKDATGSNDGESWANAYVNMSNALIAAAGGAEVWVADGIYSSDPITVYNTNVSIYGGFAGTEAARSERNWSNNVVRFDGGGNKRVVLVNGANVILDGLTIQKGRAVEEGTYSLHGGGIYNVGANLRLQNCNIVSNYIEPGMVGAGLYNKGANLQVSSCVFSNNYGGNWNTFGVGIWSDQSATILDSSFITNYPGDFHGGSAIYLDGAAAMLTVSNCFFMNNIAKYADGGENLPRGCGGAICINQGSLKVKNTAFVNNWAQDLGGAIWMRNASGKAMVIENCTFFTNRAHLKLGGAICATNNVALGITNSIFWGDTCGAGNGIEIMASDSAACSINYSSLTDTGTTYVVVNGGTLTIANSIVGNPLFVSAAAPFDVHEKSQNGHWTSSGWVADGESSPCIDAGNPASPFDLEPADNGGRINMGAYGNTVQASKCRPSGGSVITIY